ncbi:transporter [Ganoderma sinense ZZ0214-1]|uniref:Transporter n=1 Tax=Ganoderma sinense ZZ0214-1 TaxID=1077348 RepID=A0A2G8RZW7_9APHY|nr:transporter [Ganoderma sinense ZZ0214-1]
MPHEPRFTLLATLQRLELVNGKLSAIVLCHTRELAFQTKNEYTRFAKYMRDVLVLVTAFSHTRELAFQIKNEYTRFVECTMHVVLVSRYAATFQRVPIF